MILPLSPIEIRILGSLIEKELTTPEYYPLTLNALTNACNQKNNRDPIVSFDEATVVRGIDSLLERHLVITVTGAGMRVPKYKHNFAATMNISPEEVILLSLLLLRGAQTVGELRTRAHAMHEFASLTEVETILTQLSNRSDDPLVVKIQRQPGQKEARFTHLLSGTPTIEQDQQVLRNEPARLQVISENERITKLETSFVAMKKELDEFKSQFTQFKKQFE